MKRKSLLKTAILLICYIIMNGCTAPYYKNEHYRVISYNDNIPTVYNPNFRSDMARLQMNQIQSTINSFKH